MDKLLGSCFFLLFLACVSSVLALNENVSPRGPFKFISGEENLVDTAGTPAPSPSDDVHRNELVLAAKRTDRPDILNKFKRYQGGWDSKNRHYWASVGFTGYSGFILAFIWFVLFGLALILHHFCGWRIIKSKGSPGSEIIRLVLLIVFTCTAVIGCIVLSVGQDQFHGEVLHTLNYVVNRSDYTVETLRNVTDYLSVAETLNVAQIFLPPDAIRGIDKLDVQLNSAADTLQEKTSENYVKIKRVFEAVRSILIAVALVMLVLSLIGLVLSVLGLKHVIHVFIVSGWLLVAATLILCGIFIILDNAVTDTCVAIREWVDNPQAETALSTILPCVDQATTNQTLTQSKKLVVDFVNVVNQFIYTSANANPPQNQNQSGFNPYYYNQSGPLMPPLCNPYDEQLQSRPCTAQEVSMSNASAVWNNYICNVSENGICTSVGRVTPDIYKQLVAVVSESYALERYAPILLDFKDCKFVRDTFEEMASRYCPPLEHYLKTVDAGLGLISGGVMLCLLLWILCADRPRYGGSVCGNILLQQRETPEVFSVDHQ